MPAPRITSLLPSATEIVHGLGLGECLVGRSHECDFPASVRRLPICTSAKLNPSAPSAAIDREVKTLLRDAVSLYDVDAAKLRELKPDFILTQAQCKVCAVSLPEVEQAVAKWTGAKPRILSLAPQKLADVWNDLRRVADELGISERGKEVTRQLKTRMVNVIEKTCVMTKRPTVVCIEWLDPLMAAGNWVPELVELAGGKNLFGEAGQHSPWLEWKAVREKNPDVLIATPCGFDLARTRAEIGALTSLPDWSKLRAAKSGHVYLTDGNAFFNCPGPRLVESLEILAEILHPDLFKFGHEGKGWARL